MSQLLQEFFLQGCPGKSDGIIDSNKQIQYKLFETDSWTDETAGQILMICQLFRFTISTRFILCPRKRSASILKR